MSESFIPYGRQVIDDDDVAAVAAVLKSDWLTTGPLVGQFEAAFGAYVGAAHAVAVSNGTAALHLAILAARIGPGDEVIVPALTFAASANCVRYAGATVVFADVREDTLTIDPAHAASLITPRTKAIVAVDYAGLPCELDELLAICRRHNLLLIEDACHAPGATYRGRKVGGIADLTAFSLHPVKHMTSGEGGVVTSNNTELAARVRLLRNHGIATDFRQREEQGTWEYDVVELGFNYRLPDILCALALSQLNKAPRWLEHRRAMAASYRDSFAGLAGRLLLQSEPDDCVHAYHLFPIRVVADDRRGARRGLFTALRARNIGVNVHYKPVYLHSYYQQLGYRAGLCPVAERAYDSLLSLPMSHGLTQAQLAVVTGAVHESLNHASA